MAAVHHKEADRVPVDLGSTSTTTLTAGAHERLRGYLGLPCDTPPEVFLYRASIVIPDAAILRRFDVDARPLLLGGPFGRPDRTLAEDAFVDEWDVTWTRHGDSNFIYSDGPFYHLNEPSLQDLAKYAWPDPDDPGRYEGLRKRAAALHEKTDYAVILSLGLGPIHQSQFVRGFGKWLEDLLVYPAFAEALMERIVDVWIQIAAKALDEACDYVDLVMFGDDVGIQGSPMVRPELYRCMIKPQHRRMVGAVKQYNKPVMMHSCGSVYRLIPDLIDVGIDALNPIQVSAAQMDTKRLKQEFGRDLTFWGGIDTHQVLPRGTPKDVRDEVKHRIEDLGSGGGFVLCAVHNIQPEVPPENVVAMYDAAREYFR
jgi:uroporphyrinogen decarboxylase